MPVLVLAEFHTEVHTVQRVAALPCCFVAVLLLLLLASLALWIWCIIEVATKEPADDPNKLLWLLLVILLNPLGPILYLVIRRPERLRRYGR
jgi:hypothetical protein